jgi:hypothetical protein
MVYFIFWMYATHNLLIHTHNTTTLGGPGVKAPASPFRFATAMATKMVGRWRRPWSPTYTAVNLRTAELQCGKPFSASDIETTSPTLHTSMKTVCDFHHSCLRQHVSILLYTAYIHYTFHNIHTALQKPESLRSGAGQKMQPRPYSVAVPHVSRHQQYNTFKSHIYTCFDLSYQSL